MTYSLTSTLTLLVSMIFLNFSFPFIVKTKEVISFLLSSEVMPLCLQSMQIGREFSRTVVTFIVEKILSDDDGLAYVYATPDRYYAVGRALDVMLGDIENQPSPRLLKLMIPCYSCLTRNSALFNQRAAPPF
ncbi:uncharacterized protein LOC131625024 [Vicia villosa]|uniref:uncharacterized protein LOC131625024 n=1 Tax=Vicia villosa TaxID=3911 RepID=UPI00273B0893|nr:uncharacterized protein LOC131625024 [Vicia villosa]